MKKNSFLQGIIGIVVEVATDHLVITDSVVGSYTLYISSQTEVWQAEPDSPITIGRPVLVFAHCVCCHCNTREFTRKLKGFTASATVRVAIQALAASHPSQREPRPRSSG